MNQEILENYFEKHRERFIGEWVDFLSFPSISALPQHREDCLACANWLVRHLEHMGFAARLLPSSSNPVIFAIRPGRPDRPTVMYYGHYDVQPADPLDAWTTPPFAPAIRNGRVYARGAQDNKGQIFYVLKALEALLKNTRLDHTVKLIFEGDEESGSRGTREALSCEIDAIKADYLVSCDALAVAPNVPTITMGLRGMASLSVTLHGPNHDMHSGSHGGRVPNPAAGLARLLTSLHNPDGMIVVEGFYDGVSEPTASERAAINACPFDAVAFRAQNGVDPVGGETRFTPLERVGFRPTIEINGIHGGYGGPGCQTIIPASATAKLTLRLVEGQVPDRCLELVCRHLERNVPPGLRLEITEQHVGGPALRVKLGGTLVTRAQAVLEELFKRPAIMIWEGASVPIMAHLPGMAGAEALLVGFGTDEDFIHAPNESFSLDQFYAGYLFTGKLQEHL